jgi:small-conductance mechanosensitive channel
VHDALYANDIEIPFPQRDLHLRSVDPGAAVRLGAVQSEPVGSGGESSDAASPGSTGGTPGTGSGTGSGSA